MTLLPLSGRFSDPTVVFADRTPLDKKLFCFGFRRKLVSSTEPFYYCSEPQLNARGTYPSLVLGCARPSVAMGSGRRHARAITTEAVTIATPSHNVGGNG